MKIAQVNMFPYGSTGKIMLQIAQMARNHGHDAITFSPVIFTKRKQDNSGLPKEHTIFGFFFENGLHRYLGTFLGMNGCFSCLGTMQLVRKLKKFQPDVIHLHNLHNFCINLPILFRYIRKNNIRVVWTLHDCWAFTGHCPHFTMVGCDRWKTGCHHCPQPEVYPKMDLDTSRWMYALKKKWFCGIQDMTLVTPSQWLADLVKQSFLKEYPVKVIHNGIDLSIFKPTPSDFRQKHGIPEGRYLLLGVAFGWGKRKGLDVFVVLSKRLDPDRYQIVLVGTDDAVDKLLPENIISIHRTQNQAELAQIYTAADLFVNPTREENYPTVNMEAIACGTPVLTFCTGGSPEIVSEDTGAVVDCDDVDALEREIRRICTKKSYSQAACLKKAEEFDMDTKFKEYVRLYEDRTHSTESTSP